MAKPAPKPSIQIQAFYLFFIVHTMQVGAGLMGVPRIIFLEAKQNAWISILISGLFIHIVIWVMIVTLRQFENMDLIDIQKEVFGVWISRLLGTIYVVYLTIVLLSILKNYIEVVQVFIFPDLPVYIPSLLLIILVVYANLGGFRVVAGVSFVFFIGTFWLTFMLFKPITLMDWNHFTPIDSVGALEILKGAYKTTYSLLGLEILYFAYPYIRNKKDIALPVHGGVFLAVLLTLYVTVVSIGYFSPTQLEQTVWASLAMFKIVQFSIIERFDFIGVSMWMMVILPNLIAFTWLIITAIKKMYHIPKKSSLYVLGIVLFILSISIKYRMNIDIITDLAARVGFWLVFVYPFILYGAVLVHKRWQKRRQLS
ncbi:GerAB/ArcD/ProY family transporter [Thalassobacillus sp. CUG 92003]|uniref:GerAB/ArcD/ProY family transporter n=1 Tax=Thalassobacillus sp. CUG 92003 TaxID=2736641 RepID=UPI0015E798AA|nr:GerAB/ArcD/ProY family transporter [Thalassobacillus sp. CUG 92003]